ncbi:MAG TPA: maleylpyruvate isomerase N-terminal domain-containing protein [Anaerolineales bacterium]|nr:maleylpyruvate isomerase N-terminal domain-containing protein [Anaerolineales bacterium]
MPGPRVSEITARLEKGMLKTKEKFGSLSAEGWGAPVYDGPPRWTARDLAAHFYSAEVHLLLMARDVAAGGPGVPEGFDYDSFNAQEQQRLAEMAPQEVLASLAEARAATIEFARSLSEEQLDLVGRHPALGPVSLEVMLVAIYGHQLMHMREAMARVG